MNIEKISKFLLGGLLALSIIVILLFCLVGFGNPWEVDPKKNDPQLLDLLLIWTYALIVIGTLSMAASFILYIIQHGLDKSIIYTWGLPILGVGAGVIVGVINKNEHLIINGKDWNVPSEIILTDGAMIGILILSVIAIAVTVWSMIAESMSKK